MYTAYITHSDCLKHDMGQDHPECPGRLMAIHDQLIASDLLNYLQIHEAPLATPAQLVRVHEAEYIETIFAIAPSDGIVAIDDETEMNPFTLQAALRAAGAAILATDLVMEKKVANAFCAVRPPGHHAESFRAMGFCFFNNVAVAAAHALQHYGLSRVAILDFDVHHGNGTEQMFKHNPNVMICSTFQHPLYPHSGLDNHETHIVNVPLPAGTDGQSFRHAIEQHWVPALESFQPEMYFISAGFDAHWQDDMAQLRLMEADYAWVTQRIKALADQHAQGRIVSVLEGGYELHALGRSVAAHIKVLSGIY